MDGGAGGGGTLSEVYQSAKRLLLRTRDALERLERLECSATAAAAAAGGLDSPELSASIRRDVVQIQSLCIEMDRLWRFLGAKSQRDLWRRKVEQVAEEAESLKVSLDKYSSRNQQKMMEAKERAELLGRANGDSAHVLSIFDEEAQAMQSARNSSRMLEESYATGVAILSKYSEQRERLKMYSSEILLDFLRWHTEHLATDETMKNLMIRETQSYMTKKAQRRALDILNTVGLSNSVLKLIERRHHVDKWIKYAGMILTLIILYAFWRWTR